jgi:predicted PurR-regulated permease PerM
MSAGRASEDDAVTPFVRRAAAWSWRLLVILGLILAVLWLVEKLQVILVPVALAVMVTALMVPAVDWLDRRGAPRGGAVALVLLTGIAVFGGIMTFVVSEFVSGLPSLTEEVTRSIDNATDWLIQGPHI